MAADKSALHDALAASVKYPTAQAAADALGLPRKTYTDRLAAAKRAGVILTGETVGDELSKLRAENFALTTQLRDVRRETVTDEWVRAKITGLIDQVGEVEPPDWLLRIKRGIDAPGVPTLFCSDWHWGEHVYPSQVNGVNEYSLAIAHERARKLIEKTIYLLRHDVVNPDYPGIVCQLGGDMFSGDIHEELSQTNDLPLMPAMIDLYGVLLWALRALADEFGKVFVPCVTGNHGRNTRKPQAKNRNFTNFDWLLYQFLQQALKSDERFSFLIPDGPDAHFAVCGHRYLLTHGDQFRGGDGEVGMLGPVKRGTNRKQARNAAIGREFDTMVLGHWHQYTPTSRFIVNGSLKGYDEYANANNFGFEPPIQALWLTHPEYGITRHMPVYVEPKADFNQISQDWVSVLK